MDIAGLKIAVDTREVDAAVKTFNLLADAADRAQKALERLDDAAAGRRIEVKIAGSVALVTIDGVPAAA